MSGFKDMVQADIKRVFLNDLEFAEQHNIIYDGDTFEDVPIVMTGIREQDRQQLVWDHLQGLYRVTTVVHLAASDLGGTVPEKGMKIKINDGDFYREFFIASSVNEVGMLRLELEAIDE